MDLKTKFVFCLTLAFSSDLSLTKGPFFKYNFLCEQRRYYKGLDKLGLDETPQAMRGA